MTTHPHHLGTLRAHDTEDPFTPYEDHALIYTDGHVGLTLFECCYCMWHVPTGRCLGGSLWPPDVARTTQLTPEALTELRRHARGFLLVQEATCGARVVEAREALGRAKPADRVAASARVAQAEQQHAFALEQLQDLVALEPQHP